MEGSMFKGGLQYKHIMITLGPDTIYYGSVLSLNLDRLGKQLNIVC